MPGGSGAVKCPAVSTTRAALLRPSEAIGKLAELFRYLFGVVIPWFPLYKDSKQQEEEFPSAGLTLHLSPRCVLALVLSGLGVWQQGYGLKNPARVCAIAVRHFANISQTITHLTQFPALGKV